MAVATAPNSGGVSDRRASVAHCGKLWRHCQATGIRGRTLTLKVKFSDFQQITRSKSVDDAIDSLADLERLSLGCSDDHARWS
jgi:nucleotidyltransferase/DNA polymerase involved in DNA repair